MGTEDWVLKGKKLRTNTKKQRFKNLEQRLNFQKYNIKEMKEKKTTKSQKLLKKIYRKFALKNRVFFFGKVIVGYKNQN